MVRKLSIAVAAALLSTTAFAQGPMQDTWDINAPNGTPIVAGPTSVAAGHGDSAVHGHATSAVKVDRVIEVRPGTRYVNVTSGETVLFKIGGQSFTWTFDKTLDHPSFDLGQIAPASLAVQGVRIYCAPDEYERAG